LLPGPAQMSFFFDGGNKPAPPRVYSPTGMKPVDENMWLMQRDVKDLAVAGMSVANKGAA
jgi:hypothetical protein